MEAVPPVGRCVYACMRVCVYACVCVRVRVLVRVRVRVRARARAVGRTSRSRTSVGAARHPMSQFWHAQVRVS